MAEHGWGFDLWSYITGIATFLTVLIIKILLDLNTARWFVKWFSWLPLRNYFRTKPITLNGTWEQNWMVSASPTFPTATSTHSTSSIRQMGSYCYAEFYSSQKKYALFGRIVEGYMVGEWYDTNDRLGYFGTFHLQIVDSQKIRGKWIGHSKTIVAVKEGDWEWDKLPD